MQAFHASFKRCRYDLMRWRTISSLTEQQTAVLDANGGAGWELAAALLRPRKVQVRPHSPCAHASPPHLTSLSPFPQTMLSAVG